MDYTSTEKENFTKKTSKDIITSRRWLLIDEKIDEEDCIIIGNSIDSRFIECPKCSNKIKLNLKEYELIAPYLLAVLKKLGTKEYIYIKTLPYPDRLAKVQEILELLKPFGVIELIGDRVFKTEPHKKDPTKKFRVQWIKWRIHSKLIVYRQQQDD